VILTAPFTRIAATVDGLCDSGATTQRCDSRFRRAPRARNSAERASRRFCDNGAQTKSATGQRVLHSFVAADRRGAQRA